MVVGLVVFLSQLKWVAHVGNRQTKPMVDGKQVATPKQPLTMAEWERIAVVVIFFMFTMFFWAAYEQKGTSLNLFAKELVRTEIFGWPFPSSWLQSMTAFYVILLAPVFSKVWVALGDRQPSSPVKFIFGLLFIGCGYLLMIPAAMLTASGKISPLWFVALYFLEVMGEMCLSPVGLSTVTKLAPARVLGIMLGVWFLASAFGNKLAGYLAGFYDASNAPVLTTLYGGIAVGLFVAAGILATLTPTIKRMMGDVK